MRPHSQQPLLDSPVAALAVAYEYGDTLTLGLGLLRVPKDHYGELLAQGSAQDLVCQVIVPDQCLIILHQIEYELDCQGANIPVAHSAEYRDFSGYSKFGQTLNLLRKKSAQNTRPVSFQCPRRSLRSIHVWIGAGEKLETPLDLSTHRQRVVFSRPIVAYNLSVSLTFR